MESFTGVILPVQVAAGVVRERRLGARAHITLLAPFVAPDALDDGVLGELRRFFADVTPFDVRLTEVCAFPDGVVYLAPEPAATLRRLTFELHRLFPEFPPYGGAFDEVVPHLTVPLREDEDADEVRRALAPTLPLAERLSGAELVLGTTEVIHETLASFPFASTAA